MRFAAAAGLALLGAACATPVTLAPGEAADALLIVDCQLPPRIKQLGQKITYLEARRSAKITAGECADRGGEFAHPDTAGRATALAAWLPGAEAGSAEAQNYVAEAYERAPAQSPDYVAAARWYARAAESGHRPALISLGQLFETGLGVPRDAARARDLYREASGLDSVGVSFVAAPDHTHDEIAASLRADLVRARQERDDALAREAQSDSARDELVERVAALEGDLARRRAELDTLGQSREARAATDEARVQGLKQELAERTDALEAARVSLAAESERSRRWKRAEVEARDRHDALERELAAAATLPKVELPGPSIAIVEPPDLITTRGLVLREDEPVVSGAMLVGLVEAPAGLLSLLVDGAEHPVNERGVFKVELGGRPAEGRIPLVALDNQGKRTELAVRVATRGLAEPPAAPAPPELEFGRYHALVIGNNGYRHLPALQTARADARAVAELLESRYGFEVVALYDASRYEMLSALNALRKKLDERDNLVLYYAGHGELDEANQRGHWLPVDAEPDSTANWISNVAVTDILNAMSARHVVVVSDSCYSGSLTRSALARLDSGMAPESRRAWRAAMVAKRSRTALTSGGLAPVLDSGGGDHSIFARAFLEVLRANRGILEGQFLFQEIAARVALAAERYDFEQAPQYAPIKFSGHEAGDFFFVPKR